VTLWEGWEGNRGPGRKYCQPITGFMTTSLAGWLPRDQDQLRTLCLYWV